MWAFIRCDQITYRKFLRHFYSTATHFLTPDPTTTSFVSRKFMRLDQGSSLVKATPSPYLSLRFSTPSFQSYCLGFTGFGQLDPRSSRGHRFHIAWGLFGFPPYFIFLRSGLKLEILKPEYNP